MLLTEIEELKKFHGHLGPYAAIGFKMGSFAVEKMRVRGKKLKCVVRTGIKPPISCIIDGIQFSSSCTLGKGNIKVEDEGVAEAVFFRNDKKLKIRLKDNVKRRIDKEMSKENEERLSLWVYGMSNDELFDISIG